MIKAFRPSRRVLPVIATLVLCGSALVASPAGSTSTTWSATSANVPYTDSGAQITSVSCPAAGDCTAVGTFDDAEGTQQGLIFDESSGSWAPGIAAPLPTGAANDPLVQLDSVSCSAPGDCNAVGDYVSSSKLQEGLLLTEASGTWSASVRAQLPGDASTSYPEVTLTSVSCSAPESCSAVGSYDTNPSGYQGLLLTESSGTWSRGVEVQLSTSPRVSTMTSVACWSPGNCSAVGQFTFHRAGPSRVLLDSETSGTWGTATKAPLPSTHADADVFSVSCSAPGSCSAVGYYGGEALVLDESTGVWTAAVDSGQPADSQLNSVSCSEPGDCTAVGEAGGSPQGYVMTETSGVWGPGTTESISNGTTTFATALLSAVACSGPGNCAAVGNASDNGQGEQGALIDETDGIWGQGQTAPLPAGASSHPSSSLLAVSCPSGACVAGGYYQDTLNDGYPLVVSETSNTWGADPAITPSGTPWTVTLSAVACPTTQSCVAVGSAQGGETLPLVATGSDGGWTYQLVTDPSSTGTVLTSVSCEAAGDCSAVGTGGLLLTESSGVWSGPMEAALPTGGTSAALTSVSCSGAGDCSAVGTYIDGRGFTEGLLLTETSGVWAQGVEAVLPANDGYVPGVSLSSVSCAKPGDCSAVGSYGSTSGSQGLLLTESSGSWEPGVAATFPSGNVARVDTVSCATVGNCSAIGWYNDSSDTVQGLLITESSGVWEPGVEAVLPSDAAGFTPSTEPEDATVSCAAPGDCSAVAQYYTTSDRYEGVFLNEAGGTWAPGVEARLAGGAVLKGVTPTSISCSSPGDCSAVGYRAGDSPAVKEGLLFSEAAGTWGPGVDAPLPSGVPSPAHMELNSVSCPAPGDCSAVGVDQYSGVIESSGTLAG